MDLKGVEAIVSYSNTINTWCLSMIAASLLAILSTSYVKPLQKWWKLIYILFVPGWIFLAFAIKSNGVIAGRGIRAALEPERIQSIVYKLNTDFANQVCYFNWAIYSFGSWLVLYLVWWIFNDSRIEKR